MMGRLSIIIPSRNEQFLVPTVNDLLAKAAGDIEIIVVLDGYWTDLPSDPRVKVLHRGTALGMRPAINGAVQIATGTHLMKLDAHCMVAPGFDDVLRADYHEDNWVLIPRRERLDPERWAKTEDGRPPIDAHFLSYPYERPGDPSCGLHGTEWRARQAARRDVLLDEEMSSQGSCWVMSRAQWARVGPLDGVHYGSFIQEFQEIGLKTWLGGGACMVTKRTWYAHLYKGKKYGRGYSMQGFNHEAGRDYCTDFWMHDRPFFGRVYPLRWLIERFWPVPTWPADLDEAFRPRTLQTVGTPGRHLVTAAVWS